MPLSILRTVIVFLAAVVLGQSQSQPYNLTSLNGAYAFDIAGSAYDLNGYPDLIFEMGMLTADGAGNLTGNGTLSLNGSIIRRTFTGTYTINPDGTGSMVLYPTFGPNIHADLVLASGGRSVKFVLSDANNALTGTMRTQAQTQVYDVSSMNGGYEFNLTGSAFEPDGTRDLITEVGLLTADGHGGLSGSATLSLNGDIIRRTFTGNYTVNANGMGTIVLYPSFGPTIDADMIVYPSGSAVEFVLSDPSNVFAGAMKASN